VALKVSETTWYCFTDANMLFPSASI